MSAKQADADGLLKGKIPLSEYSYLIYDIGNRQSVYKKKSLNPLISNTLLTENNH
jgi:hypothetical protein